VFFGKAKPQKKALAVEAPRFGKGSGAKEDPLQPADSYIL